MLELLDTQVYSGIAQMRASSCYPTTPTPAAICMNAHHLANRKPILSQYRAPWLRPRRHRAKHYLYLYLCVSSLMCSKMSCSFACSKSLPDTTGFPDQLFLCFMDITTSISCSLKPTLLFRKIGYTKQKFKTL